MIINSNNQKVLYEFKSVGDIYYLNLQEFESYRVQIWCYSKIINMTFDKYYLLRYFIDPYKSQLLSRRRPFEIHEITFTQSDDITYQRLFEKYIDAIDLYNKKNPELMELLIANSPNEYSEKQNKCLSCDYKRINKCSIC